jgi:hypothetical protein
VFPPEGFWGNLVVFGVGFVDSINALQDIYELFALTCVKGWAKIHIRDDLLY